MFSKISIAVLFVTYMATMVFSQQLQVNSSGVIFNPSGASTNLQVVNNSGDPAIMPGSGYWGTLGTYGNPLWWLYVYGGTINEIYYYDLYSMSDSSEKENIINLESVLNKIMNVRSVRYDYREDQKANYKAINKFDKKNKIGFIAQELQNEFPEMVKLDSTSGKKRINYIEMIPVLLKAVQELKSIVDKQDSIIADLSRKVGSR